MEQKEKYFEDLVQIRTLMERSTRFISLSGLSGIFAGVFALIGAAVAYYLIFVSEIRYEISAERMMWLLILDAVMVLILAFVTAIYFSKRKAKANGEVLWGRPALQMAENVGIPLAAGGAFCLILLSKGFYGLVGPAMLIFYGVSLVSGSKYTLTDIRYLGMFQIVLGLINCFYIGYGIYFWAAGFGILHIIYGVLMYYKYER